ncbi:MAG: primosomal protein N' [Solirubrobacteraceae bacterium]|nr:primosomal protein N' [Solirubrobacteraceae bacterium]
MIARVEPLTTARALRGPFDYLAPDGVVVGSLLRVPFGRQELTGVVVGLSETTEVPAEKLVTPKRVLPQSVPAEMVALATWVAAEYCSTTARGLSLVTPPGGAAARPVFWAELRRAPAEGDRLTDRQRTLLDDLARTGPRAAGTDLPALRRLEGKGLVALHQRARRTTLTHDAVGARTTTPPPLTGEQTAALAEIETALAQDHPERLLLHGVTGSGKTEVYLRAAATALARGRTAIILVPEIALTPQIVTRFVDRFGDTVAVLHSKLTAAERRDEWHRLRTGEARVCVGPRSAVFAPLDGVGLIVVDEEHDPSYKHEGDPRYDARRVAAKRAQDAGALLLCGSATPRPESYRALRRLRLSRRVDGQHPPPVRTIDMRGTETALHPDTVDALAASRKSIVLLNRRGWSNFVDCRTCGHAWMCPNCDVALVLHRAGGYLACHHCGHRERVPQRCTECGSMSVARHGTGTEQLEHDLEQIGLPTFRLDADVRDPGAALRAFERADRGVLVGTQMVAKGHDFPDVTLGVVVDADATLRFPDFRAEERTFALVAQLAGRAGRGEAGGKVLVQTLAPDAPSIAAAVHHDADGFLAGELARREALRYPPFATLIKFVCSAEQAAPAMAAATALAEHLRSSGVPGDVLGPAPLFRLRERERAQLIVKAAERRPAVVAAGAAVATVAADKAHKGVAFSVDVDPQ